MKMKGDTPVGDQPKSKRCATTSGLIAMSPFVPAPVVQRIGLPFC